MVQASSARLLVISINSTVFAGTSGLPVMAVSRAPLRVNACVYHSPADKRFRCNDLRGVDLHSYYQPHQRRQ
jgi:hypothetical protein